MREYDFIVVGTGISGLSFALKAASHGRVAVLTKRSPEASNTAWAQGGISCVADPQDSFDAHIADTMDAGAGLCEEAVVNTIVRSAPAAIEDMTAQGVNFDREANGSFSLGREGGHTQRRILHARDTTGREISEKLLSAATRCRLRPKACLCREPRHSWPQLSGRSAVALSQAGRSSPAGRP